MKSSSRWSRQVSEGKKGNREGTLHSTINNGEIWWKIKKDKRNQELGILFYPVTIQTRSFMAISMYIFLQKQKKFIGRS